MLVCSATEDLRQYAGHLSCVLPQRYDSKSLNSSVTRFAGRPFSAPLIGKGSRTPSRLSVKLRPEQPEDTINNIKAGQQKHHTSSSHTTIRRRSRQASEERAAAIVTSVSKCPLCRDTLEFCRSCLTHANDYYDSCFRTESEGLFDPATATSECSKTTPYADKLANKLCRIESWRKSYDVSCSTSQWHHHNNIRSLKNFGNLALSYKPFVESRLVEQTPIPVHSELIPWREYRQ